MILLVIFYFIWTNCEIILNRTVIYVHAHGTYSYIKNENCNYYKLQYIYNSTLTKNNVVFTLSTAVTFCEKVALILSICQCLYRSSGKITLILMISHLHAVIFKVMWTPLFFESPFTPIIITILAPTPMNNNVLFIISALQ